MESSNDASGRGSTFGLTTSARSNALSSSSADAPAFVHSLASLNCSGVVITRTFAVF